MADESRPAAGPMQVRVAGQYVRDLSFECPNMLKVMREPPNNPNLKLEINVISTPVGPDLYETALTFKAETSAPLGTIYDLEMVYAGIFEIKNAPPEALDPMLNVNCAALLFPFLRRIAADMTREAGFPPLLLDPVDFGGLYMKKLEAKAKAMPSGKPS